MKELPLSLLSRGCGHLVPLEEGGHDGRLEVCFEPEDYFSWRARPLLLRLSRSGRLMGGGVEDPTPPKTYSTRKGHLILYSEDLVSSSSQSATNRKGQGSKQEAEPPLHTLRDLTGAILAYKRKQPREGHATGEGHPLLSRLTPPSHAHLSSAQCHPRDRLSQLTDSFDEVPSSGRFPPTPTPAALAQVPYHPRFLCSPRPSHAPSEPLPPITEGLLSQRGDGRVYLQKDIGGTSALGDFECPLTSTDGGGTHSGQYKANIPSAPMILCCSPEPGPQQEVERVRSEETHEPAHLHGSGCVENASGHGKCSLKRASVDSTWRSSRLSHINFYGGHLAGSHRVNTGQYARMGLRGRRKEDVMSDPSFSILRLPPLPRGPVVSTGSDGHGPQVSTSCGLELITAQGPLSCLEETLP
ncbi:hypothetical protein AALO_G00037320 [Alosa alosa]|uniref:Uncharacterized protein n=1 Tax=Alosa alosa TaxID=278164 RepID=A0AAV6H7A5_9TELE|nr:hypothetical protein AALO_G00037320 [Alosa alosa]